MADHHHTLVCACYISVLVILVGSLGYGDIVVRSDLYRDRDAQELIAFRLWRDTAPVQSVAIGDFDISHMGNEVVCGGQSRFVTMLSGSQNQWISTQLQYVPGAVEFLDIGDLDSTHAGNEVVVASHDSHTVPLSGGGEENPPPAEYWGIRMLEGSEGNWTSSVVFVTNTQSGKLWGLRVGDYNTSHPGDEIIACWEFLMDVANVVMYTYTDTQWSSTLIYVGNMVIMDATIGEVNSAHPGPEIIMLDEDGEYIQLVQRGDTWESTIIWDAPADYAGREVEIGDVDRRHPGNEVVVRTRFVPGIVVLSERNNQWRPRWILHGSELVTDFAVGDFNRNHPGDEVIVVRDRNVSVVWGEEQWWHQRLMWRDVAPLYCVAFSDCDPFFEGGECLVGGESWYVTRILGRFLPVFASVVDEP